MNHDLDLLSMVTSPSGEFWFTGGNGIFRFSAEAFRQNQAGQQPPSDYPWFGKADGMTSTQCSIATPNMALAPDGKLWVATVQGLAALDLQHLSFDTAKPRIFVDAVTVGRTRQPAGPELVLPPGTHHVELRFDSISLASPEKIRFQYRMDGVDPVWLDADNSLTAVYNRIPIGTHAFRIRASNSAGVWDRSGISFPVTQKPYFYQTGWFRLVVAMALVLTLTGAYRLHLYQLRAQMHARLDERVLERTRVARELHDTLLGTFQELLLMFHAVSMLPGRPVEAKQRLEDAVDRAAQPITEGRDAVQGFRTSTIERNDLAEAIRTLGEELAADPTNQNAVAFCVAVEGKSRNLRPIVRDEVYRIAAEGIRNAFRHANAKRIEVEIRYDDRQLFVKVRDNGKGIDGKFFSDDGREGHYGLRGMRERAKFIGGQLTVRSEPGSGTEVELSIPTVRVYIASTEGGRSRFAGSFSGNTLRRTSA